MARSEQFLARRRVDSIKARIGRRRRCDPHVHLARARLAEHRNHLAERRSAHERILDQDDALALQQLDDRVVLYLDSEMANRLARLDKGAADIVAAHQRHLERQLRLLGKAQRRRVARVGHRHDGAAANGWNECTPSSSMTSISPGSTSRTYSARTRSSAQVSEATIVASLTLPSTIGRKPCGSRTAISACSVSTTSEYAPRTCVSASTTRPGRSGA